MSRFIFSLLLQKPYPEPNAENYHKPYTKPGPQP